MRYVLNERYRLRGWYKQPCGLLDMKKKDVRFLKPGQYRLLLK